MSLLKEFLKLLMNHGPQIFDAVKGTLETMRDKGHFSEETMQKLIREIRPDRHEEIDQNIDAEVAANFPEDEPDE